MLSVSIGSEAPQSLPAAGAHSGRGIAWRVLRSCLAEEAQIRGKDGVLSAYRACHDFLYVGCSPQRPEASLLWISVGQASKPEGRMYYSRRYRLNPCPLA